MKQLYIVKTVYGDLIKNSYGKVLYFTNLEDASKHGLPETIVRFDRRHAPKEKKKGTQ